MKAFFAAAIDKGVYEKQKVNEPGVFFTLFYVQSRVNHRIKKVAGVACKPIRQQEGIKLAKT